MVETIIAQINDFFGALYDGAPMVAGSRYWFFMIEMLGIIILFDLLVFGWRPIVKKISPKAYPAVDYWFGQIMNLLMGVFLIAFTVYLGMEFGTAWGVWMSLSGFVWITILIIALLFLGRFVVNMLSGGGRRLRKQKA